ncbi:MAG TPA: MarR family transcriptional regulator [Sphingobium sp.]|nr:MarR family transcriptional regulator [Sphingobium sp.]
MASCTRKKRDILLSALLEALPIEREEISREEPPGYFDLFEINSQEDIEFLAGRWLSIVMRKWRKTLDDQLRAAGYSFSRWETLFYLSTFKSEGTLTSLAERLGVVGPTLVGMLNTLQREGLIARKRDSQDRRSRLITLTPAGEQAMLKMRDLTVRLRSDFLQGVSISEMKIIIGALRIVDNNLRQLNTIPDSE